MDIAYVDVVDACQMKCPTCVRGVRVMKNTAQRMSLETFSEVVRKIKKEGYRRIGLFDWTEPFLSRNLHDYVTLVKQADLWCELSTTFSLRRIDNLENTLLAGIDLITVSMSGMDQETYQVNHVGGCIEYVFRHLLTAADIIRRYGLKSSVVLRFLEFYYNAHHIPIAREFAERNGLGFEVIEGRGDPKSDDQRSYTNDFFRDVIMSHISDEAPEDHGSVCSLMFDQLVVDSTGEAFLCCAMPNHPALKIGQYLKLQSTLFYGGDIRIHCAAPVLCRFEDRPLPRIDREFRPRSIAE